jgi:hypothetical protein
MADQHDERRRMGGQATVETAFAVPLLVLMLFGAFQVARVFYVYHTLEKALRGGAGVLARTTGINYCDPADPMLLNVKRFIVYGTMDSALASAPVVTNLDQIIDQIYFYPERINASNPTEVDGCLSSCGNASGDLNSCDTANGGHAPDFVTVSLGPDGFPLVVPFPYLQWTTIHLKVSVRMPITGG